MAEPVGHEDQSAGASSSNRETRVGPIICPGHSRPIPDVSYSHVIADGYFIISGGLDKKPMLRRGDTGDWIGTFDGHKGAVWSARLNRETDRAITASADFTAKIWNAVTGDEMHELSHRHIDKTAMFTKDNSKAITGGAEKKIRIFDLNKTEADPILLEGHGASVNNIVTLPSPELFASSGDEPNIRIWDTRSLEKECKVLVTGSAVSSLELSWCGTILTATSGNEIQFWDLKTFDMIKSFKLPRELKCASLHPEKTSFVTGSMSELWVRMYDYETGDETDCRKGHHGPVRCICFSPLGNAYASGSEDGTIRIWQP